MQAIEIPDVKDLEAKAGEAAKLLEALANPRRLMILCELAQGERSVGELVRIVGLQQAALSQHLARLRQLDLVATRKQSQMVFYHLSSLAAAKVINTLLEIYCPPEPKNGKKRT